MLFIQPSQDSLSYDRTVSEEFRYFFSFNITLSGFQQKLLWSWLNCEFYLKVKIGILKAIYNGVMAVFLQNVHLKAG